MRQVPFFKDPTLLDDVLDHIGGFLDRTARSDTNDAPMHAWRYATATDRWAVRQALAARKRSVRQ